MGSVTFVSQYASTPDANSTWKRKIVSRMTAKSARFPMKTIAPMSSDPASASSHRPELSVSCSRRVVCNVVTLRTRLAGVQRFAHLPDARRNIVNTLNSLFFLYTFLWNLLVCFCVHRNMIPAEAQRMPSCKIPAKYCIGHTLGNFNVLLRT